MRKYYGWMHYYGYSYIIDSGIIRAFSLKHAKTLVTKKLDIAEWQKLWRKYTEFDGTVIHIKSQGDARTRETDYERVVLHEIGLEPCNKITCPCHKHEYGRLI